MPKVMPLPYVPIDPMIDESERMDLFLDALGDHDDGDPECRVYKLLLWAGRSRIDGHTGKISARRLTEICRWRGDPQQLLKAFLSAGWLAEEQGGYYIEGWDRHGGKVLKERERYTENKRRQRCKSRGHPRESCECPGVVHKDTPETPRRGPVGVSSMKCEVRSVKGEVVKSEEERRGEEILSLSATPQKSTKRNPDVERVIAYYREQHPTRGRHLVTNEASRHRDYKLIAARLKEGCTVDDLKLAIDGNRIDDWHRSNGKHSVEFIFRNITKVEDFISTARNPHMTAMSDKERRGVAASQAWLEEMETQERIRDGTY